MPDHNSPTSSDFRSLRLLAGIRDGDGMGWCLILLFDLWLGALEDRRERFGHWVEYLFNVFVVGTCSEPWRSKIDRWSAKEREETEMEEWSHLSMCHRIFCSPRFFFFFRLPISFGKSNSCILWAKAPFTVIIPTCYELNTITWSIVIDAWPRATSTNH